MREGWDIGFNPRARGGRDEERPTAISLRLGFNPRARGGRDSCMDFFLSKTCVSIHAPAGGATNIALLS